MGAYSLYRHGATWLTGSKEGSLAQVAQRNKVWLVKHGELRKRRDGEANGPTPRSK